MNNARRLAALIADDEPLLRSGVEAAQAIGRRAHLVFVTAYDRYAVQAFIRASVGDTLRLIPVEDIDYLRSDEKYTLVAWPAKR